MMKHFLLFLLAWGPSTALFAGIPAGAGTASLHGKVTDKTTGETIPGAQVYLPDLRVGATTDLDGNYALQGLPDGSFLVKVGMMGYAAHTETVRLSGETTRDFALSPSVTEMQDVVVTGTSKATELHRDPAPTVLVGRDFLRENASTNAMATLNKVPGVSTVGTGPNISKPVIRGLGGNRVLTLFDGVRQEGQQWGEEHGVEVDQFLVDRVEVVKGPASLMYGSDALAGVVNLLPAPPVSPGTLQGGVLGRYATNNTGIDGSIHLDGNNGRFIYGGRVSGKVASDYRNRYDGRVYGTKYSEHDLSGYLGINRPWGFTHVHVSLYDDLQEVPDGSRDSTSRRFTMQVTDADTLRPIADHATLRSFTISPVHQHVQFLRAYATSGFTLGRGRLASKLAFSRSVRQEFAYPEHPDLPAVDLRLNAFIYDIKYHFPDAHGWEATLGLNGMVQRNDASQGTELLIPSYRQFDTGPFLHARRKLGEFDVSGGVRYDVRHFSSDPMYTITDPATGFDEVVSAPSDEGSAVEHFTRLNRNFGGLSGSLGMAWNPNDQVTVKANIGRGYRAPVVAELTADGVHPGSGLFQSGSSNLKPEFNLQGDLGLFYRGTHVTASAELFHDHVSNYIYNGRLVAANGGDSLVMQGGQALPVFRYAQTTAQLQGGDLSLDIHPHPWDRLHFENTLSFVFARNLGGHGVAITDSTRYLPLIPPLRLNSELRYAFSKPVGRFANLFVKFGVQVVAAQDRFYAAYGTESRTPGYALLEAGAGADVIGAKGNTLFTVTMLGTNLADLAYQNNMSRLKYMEEFPANGTGRSGIYEMGRNVTLTLSVPFDLKPKAVPPGG